MSTNIIVFDDFFAAGAAAGVVGAVTAPGLFTVTVANQ